MIDQSIQAPESKLSAFNGVIVTFETERGNISFEKFDDSRNNLNKKKKKKIDRYFVQSYNI